MSRRAASVLSAAVLATAFALGGCARSAANMAATQPESRDLSVLKKGTPRDKIVARLGAPEVTTEFGGEMSAEVFKFVQGYSGGARTARVFAHSTMSIATLGLWEVAGTAIEGYARGNVISVRCVYDKHRLLESYEFLDGEEHVDEEITKAATKSPPDAVAATSRAATQPIPPQQPIVTAGRTTD
jgi:hypothetical protein